MKDKLLIFALGFFVAINIAATSTKTYLWSPLVIKPAKPIATVVDYSATSSGNREFVKEYLEQVYQIKTMIAANNGVFTIMEKYSE
jgi:hypothetical protein